MVSIKGYIATHAFIWMQEDNKKTVPGTRNIHECKDDNKSKILTPKMRDPIKMEQLKHTHTMEWNGFSLNRMNFLITKNVYINWFETALQCQVIVWSQMNVQRQKEYILHTLEKKTFRSFFFPNFTLHTICFYFPSSFFSAHNKKHSNRRNNDTFYLCAKTKNCTQKMLLWQGLNNCFRQ